MSAFPNASRGTAILNARPTRPRSDGADVEAAFNAITRTMTEPSDTGVRGLGSMPSTSSAAYAARSRLLTAFDHFAATVTRWCGSPVAFCLAIGTVVLWATVGPLFGYSEDWQLVINTGTTIITFLMVFLIQQSQNKDSVALHLKLNELLAAHKSASNRMIGIETLDEQDLREVAAFYARLADRAKTSGGIKEVHSFDEEGMPAAGPVPDLVIKGSPGAEVYSAPASTK
jgi:low affinity Fe/Cu permease